MRKAVVFSMVLLMASCWLVAFPVSKKSLAAEPATVIVDVVEAVEVPTEAPQEALQEQVVASEEAKRVEELESALLAMSKKLESLQSEVSSTKMMTTSKKSELDGIVEAIASDVEIVLADLEEKESIIAGLAEANAAQADKLAYLQGMYDKETSSKFYTKFGGAFGIKNEKVQFGVLGDMGIRIGKGLVIGTGVQFMGFTMDNGLKYTGSMDDLTVSMTIGWEW